MTFQTVRITITAIVDTDLLPLDEIREGLYIETTRAGNRSGVLVSDEETFDEDTADSVTGDTVPPGGYIAKIEAETTATVDSLRKADLATIADAALMAAALRAIATGSNVWESWVDRKDKPCIRAGIEAAGRQ